MMNKRTVIVTGSRKWSDAALIHQALNRHDPLKVVQGGAVGADAIAREWCKARGRCCVTLYPDWQAGKGAARESGVAMLRLYPEAIVLAFSFPDSHGTRFVIEEASHRGMKVYVFEGDA